MRLLSFFKNGVPTAGLRIGENVIDLSIAAPDLPKSMKAILAEGEAVREWLAEMAKNPPQGALIKAGDIAYAMPVPDPDKIICVGLNYRDHAIEGKQEIPTVPVFFLRLASSMVAHGQDLWLPKVSSKYDYEAELAVVIGKRGRHVPKEKALELVAGYTLCNDGSVRDYQKRTAQWTMGKNFDKSGSLGPEIVTADELPVGAKGLKVRSILNGQVMQDGNTDDMIFDIATLVSQLTEVMTLEPGDIISTGTPAGVGFARTPPVWMKAGDTVEIEIEKIGKLINKVVTEPI
ncbi:MAG: fumarylacetoacetate hydrolase family protein [Alphaproteobacteria bacterium]|nr:fumarylacetoacetate hydrolase family protein [Alphaproteobacteria bacterium]